ncbi:tumor necrosis factor receptor superfamily member 6B-like isoform X1 [Centroberyx gerrardi]|uniref:tumor necrosis factor receptor superfamily member 6B-like isoform X1 n=1 Tax=Centroberyx gerrardi TaxID=166262 RepID=UPI003AB0DC89
MHNISMLFLLVLFLLMDLLHGAVVVETTPTYEHRDPASGQLLTCARCPAGTHMAAHCTATTPTECVPCKADHFTELWNYLPRCLYCNTFCGDNQEVETECSPVSNRVCRCKDGYYSDADFCVKHSECGLGHGVKTKGTSRTNTVCGKCAEGFFSDSSSALEPCVQHRECNSTGEVVLLRGSSFHDAVCGTCEELTDGGDVKVLRTFLPGFFALHKMRAAKMKKFVTRYIQTAGEGRHPGGAALPGQRGSFLGQIRAWLAQAPGDQLRRLPQMLKASQLNCLADKLERRLGEIQQHAPQCNPKGSGVVQVVSM